MLTVRQLPTRRTGRPGNAARRPRRRGLGRTISAFRLGLASKFLLPGRGDLERSDQRFYRQSFQKLKSLNMHLLGDRRESNVSSTTR